MTDSSARLRVESGRRGDAVIAHVAGEIDRTGASLLAEKLASALDSSARVVVDLAGVTFLGTSGLAALVDARARFQANGASVRVVPSHPVRRAIDVTGLNTVLQPFSTVSAAIRADSP